MRVLFTIFFLFKVALVMSQVNINIDFNQQGKSYSPYIFGKNNSLSDNASKPLANEEWARLKDAGITIFRENGGEAEQQGIEPWSTVLLPRTPLFWSFWPSFRFSRCV